MTLRLGCDVPYFEDPDDIRTFAQAAEEIGFDHIGFSEHVASSRLTEYPALFSYDDPWHESFTMLAFLAAVTTTIEVSSAMALVTLRDPVLVAKQAAEVDLLSRAGCGSRSASAGTARSSGRSASIRRRGVVASKRWCRCSGGCGPKTPSPTAVSRSPSTRWASIHGLRAPIPIWMGGGGFETQGHPGEVSMRRAARLADGFKLMAPTGGDVDRAIDTARRLHELAAAEGRTIDIEARLLTQLTPPDEWASVVARYRDAGSSPMSGWATASSAAPSMTRSRSSARLSAECDGALSGRSHPPRPPRRFPLAARCPPRGMAARRGRRAA